MAQGVCKRLARCQRGIQRLVDSLETGPLKPSGDGQGVAQEALCARERREGVAVELAIVQELHPVGTPEAGDAQQTLRHLELQPLRAAEQHRRRPKQHAVMQQATAAIC